MNLGVETLVAIGVSWLCLCFLTGVKRRFTLFLALLFLGVSVTSMWLSATLKVAPLDPQALVFHACALICAVCVFFMGLFFARIGQQWRDSRVEEGDI